MPDIEKDKIAVSHLNIRPSISLLLMQLILLNILALAIIIGLYLATLIYSPAMDLFLNYYIGLPILGLIFLFQITLMVYGVLQWLNEYYEITTKMVYHKKGLVFRSIQKYPLEAVKYISLDQDFLGKIFNYGTIMLYDQRREKRLDLYLIHNPIRYMEVFEKIAPALAQDQHILRQNIIETDEP